MLLSLAEVEQTLVHIALINTDKTTFILGIGIGRACARALAKDGAAGLLIADIDTSAAQETAAQCQEVANNRHFRVETTHVDITDEMSVVTATSVKIRVFGQIDYCVDCAGIGPDSNAEIADSDLFAYQRMLDVNTTSIFLVILQISDLMRGQDPRRLLSPLGDHRESTRGAIIVLAKDRRPRTSPCPE